MSENEIIWECLDKLKKIFNDDMHGYISEVYNAVSIAIDKAKKRRKRIVDVNKTITRSNK